ncbi:MAG: hypothetical protein ACK5TO_04005, partial [Planctomycetaceae bacterium]
MRFEVELTLSGKHFHYSLSFEGPTRFAEARVLDESLSVEGQAIFTRRGSRTQLSDGPAFGLDCHIVALPVINERPEEHAIQDLKTFFATMMLLAPIPANISGFSEAPSTELQGDGANYASCLRALLGQKPAAYSVFD